MILFLSTNCYQVGHKGNGQEWSLDSIIIGLVLKIEKCFLSLHVHYCHTSSSCPGMVGTNTESRF
jgi:hypothetical protein